MTRESQKILELYYAQEAFKIINEDVKVLKAPSEEDYPDLIANDVGLEVRQVFKDQSKKGSISKRAEVARIDQLGALASEYYKRQSAPIKIVTNWNIIEITILDRVVEVVASLSEWDRGRITSNDGSFIEIQKLPTKIGEYKRWTNISNHMAWVQTKPKETLQQIINDKNKKIDKYMTNLEHIDLLLVIDRTASSGMVNFDEIDGLNKMSFRRVLIFLYPDVVHVINAQPGGSSEPLARPAGL